MQTCRSGTRLSALVPAPPRRRGRSCQSRHSPPRRSSAPVERVELARGHPHPGRARPLRGRSGRVEVGSQYPTRRHRLSQTPRPPQLRIIGDDDRGLESRELARRRGRGPRRRRARPAQIRALHSPARVGLPSSADANSAEHRVTRFSRVPTIRETSARAAPAGRASTQAASGPGGKCVIHPLRATGRWSERPSR